MVKLISVEAQFHTSSQRYTYLVPEGDKPKVGDFILTSVDFSEDSAYYTSNTIHNLDMIRNARFARVCVVHEAASIKGKKFYVHLFSAEGLKEKIKANKELAEQYQKQAEARAKLNIMLLENNALMLYEKLAATDPEAQALLAIIKG